MLTVEQVAEACKLPERWVRRAARARGGKPHDASFACRHDCKWCSALRWVQENEALVRVAAIELDRQEQQEREHTKILAAEAWKRDHNDLWDFLNDMMPGPFREAAIKAVDSGVVSDKMEEAVKAASRRKPVTPPDVGSLVDSGGTVLKAEEANDRRGTPVIKVTVTMDDGWKCRIDRADPVEIATWRGVDSGTRACVKGQVAWRADYMAIVDGSIKKIR